MSSSSRVSLTPSPFTPTRKQVSQPAQLSCAQRYAKAVSAGVHSCLKDRYGAISLGEDLFESFLELAYQAGYRTALEVGYVREFEESHPRMEAQ